MGGGGVLVAMESLETAAAVGGDGVEMMRKVDGEG